MMGHTRLVGGSVFHKVEPETAKHRCPHLLVLERGAAGTGTTAADGRVITKLR